nr:MAG TPA: hypothetical protein [Caudoviricetes sp.]
MSYRALLFGFRLTLVAFGSLFLKIVLRRILCELCRLLDLVLDPFRQLCENFFVTLVNVVSKQFLFCCRSRHALRQSCNVFDAIVCAVVPVFHDNGQHTRLSQHGFNIKTISVCVQFALCKITRPPCYEMFVQCCLLVQACCVFPRQPARLIFSVHIDGFTGNLKQQHQLVCVVLKVLVVLLANINDADADSQICATCQRRHSCPFLSLDFQTQASHLNSVSFSDTTSRITCVSMLYKFVTLSALSTKSGTCTL